MWENLAASVIDIITLKLNTKKVSLQDQDITKMAVKH